MQQTPILAFIHASIRGNLDLSSFMLESLRYWMMLPSISAPCAEKRQPFRRSH